MLVGHKEHQGGGGSDGGQCHQIAGTHPDYVAEQGGLEVTSEALVPAYQHYTNGETGGGDHSNCGVVGDFPLLGGQRYQLRAQESPDRRPNQEVERHYERDHRAAKNSVGQAMSNVGHSLQDDIDANGATQGAGHDCGHHSPDDKGVTEGFQDYIKHGYEGARLSPRRRWSRRYGQTGGGSRLQWAFLRSESPACLRVGPAQDLRW